MQHRGLHARGHAVHHRHLALDKILGQRLAFGAGQHRHLVHHLLQQAAQLGVGAGHADRQPGQPGEAGQADQQHELFPYRAAHIVLPFGFDAGVLAGGEKRAQRRFLRRMQRAKTQARKVAAMFDQARRGDLHADVGRTERHRFGADLHAEHLGHVDAVLQRQHHGARTHYRRELLGGRLDIGQLDGEEHQVRSAEHGRVVRDCVRVHQRVAERALQPQAAVADRLGMPAARHEGNPLAGLKQPRPEVAADAAGANDHDVHAGLQDEMRKLKSAS